MSEDELKQREEDAYNEWMQEEAAYNAWYEEMYEDEGGE